MVKASRLQAGDSREKHNDLVGANRHRQSLLFNPLEQGGGAT